MSTDLNEQTRGRLQATYRAADTRGRAQLIAELAYLSWWNAAIRARVEDNPKYQNHAAMIAAKWGRW